MRLLVVADPTGGGRSWSLRLGPGLLLFFLCFWMLVAGAGGYAFYQWQHARDQQQATRVLDDLGQQLQAQGRELKVMQGDANAKLHLLAARMGVLQARTVRMDALSAHLARIAGVGEGEEAGLGGEPGLGGALPISGAAGNYTLDLIDTMGHLSDQIERRLVELDVLERILLGHQSRDEMELSGRPAEDGWVTSGFGYRTDPFSGKIVFHEGIDLGGHEGSGILSMGAGVVVRSEKNSTYGHFVEIAHGDSLVTRYAHNQKNLVKVGDVVRKGDLIATMGNTGRSTGAHVHFEVIKGGRPVNPALYISPRS